MNLKMCRHEKQSPEAEMAESSASPRGTYQPFCAPSHMVGAALVQVPAASPFNSASGSAVPGSGFSCPFSLKRQRNVVRGSGSSNAQNAHSLAFKSTRGPLQTQTASFPSVFFNCLTPKSAMRKTSLFPHQHKQQELQIYGT